MLPVSISSTYQSDVVLTHEQKVAEKNDRSNIQVVICSCNSHISSKDIHILSTSIPQAIIAIPSLERLRSLATNYLPLPQTMNDLQSQFQESNIPSRALKYVRNPLKLLDLASRSKVQAQQILSLRFMFNITCVILWVLVRKFLEIFGIRMSAFASKYPLSSFSILATLPVLKQALTYFSDG